jgi:hypothetical protein
LHCRSTHSRLSQAASRSSGMWRQQMLLSILHGCHFVTISSFSAKNSVSDIFDQTSYTWWRGALSCHAIRCTGSVFVGSIYIPQRRNILYVLSLVSQERRLFWHVLLTYD